MFGDALSDQGLLPLRVTRQSVSRDVGALTRVAGEFLVGKQSSEASFLPCRISQTREKFAP